MNTDAMQKLGQHGMDMALKSFGAWTKNTQVVAAEVADYSKKSFEGSTAAWEKALAAKSLERLLEVQNDYLKSSYENFVAEATKLGELCIDFANETYKPLEGMTPKMPSMK